MPTPTMHSYKVRIQEGTGGIITAATVTAAYFDEDGLFTVFKDDQHAKVYAVRSERLLTVERGVDPATKTY